MKRRAAAGAALLGCLLAGSSSAATDPEAAELAQAYGERQTVSIATGREQPLRRAPAIASVITADDIAAIGASDFEQLLEAVAGLHIGRNNQGYGPLYQIRGIVSEFNPQTLVLLNGVPLTHLFIGNRGNIWGGLPVQNIARIEVIRGPGSAFYGADAFAGVINVITKSAAETPGTEAGAKLGSFATREAWLQHGGRVGPLEVAVFARTFRTDGFERVVEIDAQTANDAVFGTRASLAPGRTSTGLEALDGGLDVRWNTLRARLAYLRRSDYQVGAGVAGALDPVGRAESERTVADLAWRVPLPARDWTLELAASRFTYVTRFPSPLMLFPPGTSFAPLGGTFPAGMFGAPNQWDRTLRLGATFTFTSGRHHVRLGAGHDDLHLHRTQEFTNFTLRGVTLQGPGGTTVVYVPVPRPDGLVEVPVGSHTSSRSAGASTTSSCRTSGTSRATGRSRPACVTTATPTSAARRTRASRSSGTPASRSPRSCSPGRRSARRRSPRCTASTIP